MEAKHTPGPWAWFGNRSGGVYLATPHSGRRYVMSFRRYGMNGAQPAFPIGGIMTPAAELVSFVVGDDAVRGFKEADADPSVYRYDVKGIDHPDARLIAASPDLLSALECEEIDLAFLRRAIEEGDPKAELLIRASDCLRRIRAAIARATGAA